MDIYIRENGFQYNFFVLNENSLIFQLWKDY
jgi:hypothetical protein